MDKLIISEIPINIAKETIVREIEWGDITGNITDQADLNAELSNLSENKLDKIDYVQHFRGLFSSFAALVAALPTALDGDYAHIDSGSGFDRMVAIWDADDNTWLVKEVNVPMNTDEMPEGSTNLYFTSERVRQTSLAGLDLSDSNAVVSSDAILVAIGKLQAQLNNAQNSGVQWHNFFELPDVAPSGAINLANTNIEVANINGLLWIRGYFQLTGNMGNGSITFATNANADFQVDVFQHVDRRVANIYSSSIAGSVLYLLEVWQNGIAMTLVNKTQLYANQIYIIQPVAIGKIKV